MQLKFSCIKECIMSKNAKLLKRLLSKPKDFTFDELKTLLLSLGYKENNAGKTSGSRVKFQKNDVALILHKPHPRKELLEYQIKQVIEILSKEEL